MESQQIGGISLAFDSPLTFRQNIQNVAAFDFLKSSGPPGTGAHLLRIARSFGPAVRISQREDRPLGHHQTAFDDVFKFANIPGPIQLSELLHSIGRDLLDPLAALGLFLANDVPDQERNIDSPLIERGYFDHEHGQPEVEIRSE